VIRTGTRVGRDGMAPGLGGGTYESSHVGRRDVPVILDDLAINPRSIPMLGAILAHPTVTRQTAAPPLARRRTGPHSCRPATLMTRGRRRGGEIMASGDARDPVCPVCSRSISQGNGLAFLRRENLIHGGCLAAAQRRAQASSTMGARAGEAALIRESRPTSQGQSTRGSHG
jgi:hypothetical protein